MSDRREVSFTGDAPDEARIGDALRAYVGGAGRVWWSQAIDRWVVDLTGEWSSAVPGAAPEEGPRAFEIVRHPRKLVVITRHADEYTAAVAEGFAALAVSLWRGLRAGPRR